MDASFHPKPINDVSEILFFLKFFNVHFVQKYFFRFFSKWINVVRSFGLPSGSDGGEETIAREEEDDREGGENLQRDEHVQPRPIQIHQY